MSIYRQVYNAGNDDSILVYTDEVICVLTRRGILAAGFNGSGELLAIHYVGYKNDRPVWDLDFFEPLFDQEPLLMRRDKVTKVFFCTERNLAIPDELYDASEAEKWFRKIHFVELTDTIINYRVKEEYLYYTYAIPVNIKQLIAINCPNAQLMPLPVYQLSNYNGQKEQLQCFITPEQASVVWYKNNKLFWHRVFEYSNAEEIAYNIRLVCEEHNINAARLDVACNIMSAGEYNVANNLSQYFNSIYTGHGKSIQSIWDPVISLIQQLSACA